LSHHLLMYLVQDVLVSYSANASLLHLLLECVLFMSCHKGRHFFPSGHGMLCYEPISLCLPLLLCIPILSDVGASIITNCKQAECWGGEESRGEKKRVVSLQSVSTQEHINFVREISESCINGEDLTRVSWDICCKVCSH